MQEPNYKLIFNDGVLVPKHESKAKDFIKWMLLAFLIIGIVMSIILGEIIFDELSITAWVCVLLAVGFLVKNSGHERVDSPCELWFFDEYLIQYRPRIYYSKNNIRREYYKFYYKDIKQCVFRTVSKKFNIFGIVEGTFYKYDKNGNLEREPSYHKTVDAISKFYVTQEPNIDFIGEIEPHSPIKVEVQDN